METTEAITEPEYPGGWIRSINAKTSPDRKKIAGLLAHRFIYVIEKARLC